MFTAVAQICMNNRSVFIVSVRSPWLCDAYS